MAAVRSAAPTESSVMCPFSRGLNGHFTMSRARTIVVWTLSQIHTCPWLVRFIHTGSQSRLQHVTPPPWAHRLSLWSDQITRIGKRRRSVRLWQRWWLNGVSDFRRVMFGKWQSKCWFPDNRPLFWGVHESWSIFSAFFVRPCPQNVISVSEIRKMAVKICNFEAKIRLNSGESW